MEARCPHRAALQMRTLFCAVRAPRLHSRRSHASAAHRDVAFSTRLATKHSMDFLGRVRLCGFAVTVLCIIAGCGTGAITPANPQIPVSASTAQLRSGDSLNIALQGVPDASANTVQIDEQGVISLPYV